MEHHEFDRLLKVQLGFWQGVLKLNDWDIKLDYWPHEAMEDAVSKIKWNRNSQHATIALRIPEDIPPVERNWPENEAADYDVSLVHELLHLKCIPMEGKYEWAEEVLANHVSRAMVKLYREGHTPATGMNEVEEVKETKPTIGLDVGHYL